MNGIPKKSYSAKRGFTLIELLIIIGVISILATLTVLVINPVEQLARARDSKRLKDLRTLSEALSFSLTRAALSGQTLDLDGTNTGTCSGEGSPTIYVSVPDSELPPNPAPSGWSYGQVSSANLYKVDGSGWLPIDFIASFLNDLPPLSKLPVDPVNTFASGNYYSYVCGSYELSALFESSKFQTQAAGDGGDKSAYFEIGTNLTATPVVYAPENNSYLCSDGLDNDGDTLVDLSDPDCTGSPTPPPFDFSLAASGNITVNQGASNSNTITATLVSGTANSVTFSASGLPLGATYIYGMPSCSPTCSSMLTIDSGTAAVGSYTITASATDGSITKTTTFTLTVNSVSPFDFSLGASGAIAINQGSSGGNTITATLVSGTANAVTFSAFDLPAGASYSYATPSCSPTCSSTLNITAANTTAIGSYTITASATDGGITRTTTFTLTVSPFFVDTFDSAILGAGWIFDDPGGGGSYSLTLNPSHLQIVVSGSNDCWTGGNPPCPKMLRSVTSADAVYEVDIDGQASLLSSQAYGIMIWQDATNYMRFEYIGGNAAAYKIISNVGSTAITPTAATKDGTNDYLRVSKVGNTYTLTRSDDGTTWITVGSFTQAGFTPAQAGVYVITTSAAVTANFDSFTITTQ